jgi:hypothetical protein
MGRGYLMPDTRTLEDCQVPVFKTHPTPINVSIKPDSQPSPDAAAKKKKKEDGVASGRDAVVVSASSSSTPPTSQGCSCVIL